MKTLRPYQSDCVAAVNEALSNSESTLVVLPTGTGKTVVFAKITKAWTDGDHTAKPANVLILAHRKELIHQAQHKVGIELGYDPAIEMAILSAEVDAIFGSGMAVVGSVQTMVGERRLEKYRPVPFDLIIIDEAHHAVASSYQKIVNYFRTLNARMKVLGVTATPKRADDAAMGIVFKTCAYELGILEAINDGWLVPIEQEFVYVDSVNLDEVGCSKNDMGDQDFKQGELQEIMLEKESLYGIATPIFEKAGDKRCLVFTAGVRHAHELAAILNGMEQGCAAAVDGKTEPFVRKSILSDFRKGRIRFVCNFGVLTEGYDLPDIGVVAMARPTRSEGCYTQMLGRGTRPLDGIVDGPPTADERRAAIAASTKPHVKVLDFVGNSRFKLVSAVDVLGGNYDVEIRELAAERVKRNPQDVQAALERAQKDVLEERERKRLAAVKTKVQHTSQSVDPFGRGDVIGVNGQPVTRGGASDAQIQFLCNLGVEKETAMRYSKRQAGVVIDKMKDTHCTVKMRKILTERGWPTEGVGMDEAGRIIDYISQSRWTAKYVDASNPFKEVGSMKKQEPPTFPDYETDAYETDTHDEYGEPLF